MKKIIRLLALLLIFCLLPGTAAAEAGGKRIYLTFDDGPGPYTARLLDILAREDVKATFFVTGKAADHPELIRRMAAEGHTVALHCYSHDYERIYASSEAYFDDLCRLEALLAEDLGYVPRILRFPGGSSNAVSFFNPGIMSRLSAEVTEAGYCYVDWNVDSRDSIGCRSAAGVLRNMQQGVEGLDSSVILLHDIYAYSVDAVESFIRWGKEQGCHFYPITAEGPTARHIIYN